jgi:hypothetical protein
MFVCVLDAPTILAVAVLVNALARLVRELKRPTGAGRRISRSSLPAKNDYAPPDA